MFTPTTRSWIILTTMLCLAAAGSAGGVGPQGFDARSWLSGPDGLVKGVTAAELEGKILVVYFYTDWCGYCRQFEKNLLGTPAFNTFLSEAVAVRINPDKGDRERSLAVHYGVRGFPAFFVYGNTSKRLIRTERYDVVSGKPEMLGPDAFIDRIRWTSER